MQRAVPDPHGGRKGTCLGPRALGGPRGPLVVHLSIGKRGGKMQEESVCVTGVGNDGVADRRESGRERGWKLHVYTQ